MTEPPGRMAERSGRWPEPDDLCDGKESTTLSHVRHILVAKLSLTALRVNMSLTVHIRIAAQDRPLASDICDPGCPNTLDVVDDRRIAKGFEPSAT